MYISKVYIPLSELSEFFARKLSEDDKKRFKGYEFVPIDIKLNEADMSLEALFIPTPSRKNGESDLQRKHI